MTTNPADSLDRVVLGRRQLILGAGAVLIAAACSDEDDATTPVTEAADDPSPTTAGGGTADTVVGSGTAAVDANGRAGLEALTPADFEELGTCALLRETTAGPFGLDEQYDRFDITEDYPGQPVRLGLRLVDKDCQPIGDGRIEIWQADASGDYSAFIDDGDGKDEAEGTTFLRGTQPVSGDGIVEFTTIYPGFYPGRPPHIHLRLHRDGEIRFTTQLFFPDEVSDAIYITDAYAEFGQDYLPNGEDSIARDALTGGSLLTTTDGETTRGSGLLAVANLAVDL